MSVGQQQVEFFFTGVPLNDPGAGARTDYAGFNLNGVEYKVGDCAFLYPEDEGVPPYVGKILTVFHNRTDSEYQYCVEVAWFERRAHLEPADPPSSGWEREVVALEETDINPIGCISGKAVVLKAACWEEANQMAQSMDVVDWLFCRGVYKAEDTFVPYPDLAEQMEHSNCRRTGKRSQAVVSGQAEGVADSDDVKRRRFVEEPPAVPVRRTGKLVSGRTCVECGATQTPQWREGPAGPKTLCNACGVRYVRAQQRANKGRAAPAGASRASCGSGGRQSRAGKGAKAEAASVRATKAVAHEVSQRPLRQAALMAASKTAQYARTGVFPQDATELEAVDGADLDTTRHHQHQHHRGEAACTAAVSGHDPASMAALARSRPATPNCSSFESSGSLHEGGVTVEVVVGPADGDGDCCMGMELASGIKGSDYNDCLGAGLGLSGATLLVQQSMEAVASASPFIVGLVPADCAGVPVAASLLAAAVPQPQSLTAAGSGLLLQLTQGAKVVSKPGEDAMTVCMGASSGGPPFSDACTAATACGCKAAGALSTVDGPAVLVQQQVLSAPVSPSRRSSYGGGDLTEAVAAAQPPLNGPAATADDCLDNMYGVYGGQLGCVVAGLDDDYGSLVEVEVDFGLGPSSGIGSGALFDESFQGGIVGADDPTADDFNHQLPYPLNRQAGLCLSHAAAAATYGPAPQPDMDGTSAAAHTHLTVNDIGSNNLNGTGTPDNDFDDVMQEDAGIRSAADLPGAAALAAAFCSDLAPGSEVRELLDAMPSLSEGPVRRSLRNLQQHQQSSSGGSSPAAPATGTGASAACGSGVGRCAPASAFAAAAAATVDADEMHGNDAAASPLPDAAVSELVTLGRRVSRAATEALATGAALEAATKALEAHQEAARRAAEAAAANLGLLRERLSSLTANGTDSLAADALKPLHSGNCSGAFAGASSGLIDLRDLGAGYLGTGGAGAAVGGFSSYCCSFDAGELTVAVHS